MKKTLILLSLLQLSACASMTSGTIEGITVTTTPFSPATCLLSNDKGTWTIASPDKAIVNRSENPLTITCTHGDYKGTQVLHSDIKRTIYLAGFIGASIDMSTNAAYNYPNKVNVNLTKGE